MTSPANTYPERIIPLEDHPGVVSLHLKRYDFALAYCRDKIVLDIACGVGYGSSYLSKAAKRVVGGEIDEESIRYAQRHYAAPNIEFKKMDATRIDLDGDRFDVVCSFETIEHLHEIDRYLSEVARVLKNDGIYIVSTPQVKKTNPRPANPYHTIEFSKKDFLALLGRFFGEIELFGQRRVQSELHYYLQKLDRFNLRSKLFPRFLTNSVAKGLNTTPLDEVKMDDIVISKDKLERATEFLAVCRRPRK